MITCEIHITECEIYITTCEIHITTCEIHITTCEIYITTCKIHVMTREIPVITCDFTTYHVMWNFFYNHLKKVSRNYLTSLKTFFSAVFSGTTNVSYFHKGFASYFKQRSILQNIIDDLTKHVETSYDKLNCTSLERSLMAEGLVVIRYEHF